MPTVPDYQNLTVSTKSAKLQDLRGVQVRGWERRSVRGALEGAQARQLLPQPRLHAAKEETGKLV